MPRDGACILWPPASCASASESKGGAAGQKRANAQHVVVRCRSGCSHRPITFDMLNSPNSRMKERNYTSTWARNPNAKRAVQIPVELRANASRAHRLPLTGCLVDLAGQNRRFTRDLERACHSLN